MGPDNLSGAVQIPAQGRYGGWTGSTREGYGILGSSDVNGFLGLDSINVPTANLQNPVQPPANPQNPMQPPVNLSGFRGAPTAQGVGVAGMMPGFGGMASQAYMAALGKGYQASMQNPVSALQGETPVPLPREMNNPMSSSTASMPNGYYTPPTSVNQGRQYGLTIPMDLAGQKNRIANQNPMYAGMQGRFGAGSVIGQQAAMIAQNEGAGNIRIPGSYGEMPTYVQKGPSPEVKTRSLDDGTGRRVSYIQRGEDPASQVLNRQFDSLKNFTPNAERGQNRKAAREATKARLADSRFKMQVSKGLNPNSAKAKAMFPDQVAKLKGVSANNPMNNAVTITSTSPKSTTSISQTGMLASATVNGVPGTPTSNAIPPSDFGAALASKGYDPESGDMGTPNLHVWELAQSGTSLAPDDVRSLRTLAVHAREIAKGKKGGWFSKADPFYGIGTGPYSKNEDYQKRMAKHYSELADLPEDAPDNVLSEWASSLYGTIQQHSRFP